MSISRKNRSLLFIARSRPWEVHLRATVDEVFDVFPLYFEDLIDQFGNFCAIKDYINSYIQSNRINCIIFGVERLLDRYSSDTINWKDVYHNIICKNIYPVVFDDSVFHEETLRFLKAGTFHTIFTACPCSAAKFSDAGIKSVYLPLEGHKKWYFDSDLPRDIDVLFFGTLKKGERLSYLTALQEAGISCLHVGDDKRSLSVDELCGYIRRAKIVLNFSESVRDKNGNIHFQLKGRVLEAGFCGALCVSEYAEPAAVLFGDSLPQFSSIKGCIALIRHFLTDPNDYKQKINIFLNRCEKFRPSKIFKNFFDENAIQSNNNINESAINEVKKDLSKKPKKESFVIVYGNHGNGIHVADILLLIKQALEIAGHSAKIEEKIVSGRINILLENFNDNFVQQAISLLKSDTRFILVATEFLTGDTFNNFGKFSECSDNLHYGKRDYWKKRHQNFGILAKSAIGIWHLNEEQAPLFRAAFPESPTFYLPHGYIESLKTVKMRPDNERDIDFLFTGTQTKYRLSVLENLKQQGYRVVSVTSGTPPFYREDLVSRSCVALNIRQYHDWPYPSPSRFHYHLTNDSLLLSEQCEKKCDLDLYVQQTDDIVQDAVNLLRLGNFTEKAIQQRVKFQQERPMGSLMLQLLHNTFLGLDQ